MHLINQGINQLNSGSVAHTKDGRQTDRQTDKSTPQTQTRHDKQKKQKSQALIQHVLLVQLFHENVSAIKPFTNRDLRSETAYIRQEKYGLDPDCIPESVSGSGLRNRITSRI